MGSASAKSALIAPISCRCSCCSLSPSSPRPIASATATNIIRRCGYFALVIDFLQRYSQAGIGTIVTTMINASVLLLIGWTVLLRRLDSPDPAPRRPA